MRSSQPIATDQRDHPSKRDGWKGFCRRAPGECLLTPSAAVLLAVSFGLCAGYLDLFLMLFRKLWWDDEWIYRRGRDFAWTVPTAQVVLLLVAAMVIAAVSRLWPRIVSITRRGRGCLRRSRSGRPF